jgi:hypothetical protein
VQRNKNPKTIAVCGRNSGRFHRNDKLVPADIAGMRARVQADVRRGRPNRAIDELRGAFSPPSVPVRASILHAEADA